ncbi:MAG: DUF2306 domain-containing protein [Planifilum sp.]
MDVIFAIARWTHIASGFTALLVFWIPIIVRKGGKAHTRFGWIYVAAMALVSVSALYMGIYRIAWNAGSDEQAIPFSWFLIFIAILSGAAAWYGIRVLRYKRRTVPHRHAADLLFPALLIISGIGICLYGWSIGFPLLQYFPFLGLFLGSAQLLYWLTAPKRRSHWIVEHLIGMLSCCISTVTAFVVFGAPRLLGIPSVNLLLWFLPTIAIVPIIVGFSIHYQKKMDHRRTA